MYVLIALLGVAFLVWLFLTPAGPGVARGRPLEYLGQCTPRLAISIPGSRLEVREDNGARRFLVTKGPDRGGAEQTLVASFEEADWNRETFHHLIDDLRGAAFVLEVDVRGVAPARVLDAKLQAKPQAMGFYGERLGHLIAEAMGRGSDRAFTFLLWSGLDGKIWRRINLGAFREMSAFPSSAVTRWYGRRQLKKYEKEKRSEEAGGT